MCHCVLKAVEKYTWNKQEQKRPQEKPTNSRAWQVCRLLLSTALRNPPVLYGCWGRPRTRAKRGFLRAWNTKLFLRFMACSRAPSALKTLSSSPTGRELSIICFHKTLCYHLQSSHGTCSQAACESKGRTVSPIPGFSMAFRLLRAVIRKFVQPVGTWRTIFGEWEGSIRTSFMLNSNPEISKKSSFIIL